MAILGHQGLLGGGSPQTIDLDTGNLGLDASATFGTTTLDSTVDISLETLGLSASPTFGAARLANIIPATGFSASPTFGTPTLYGFVDLVPTGLDASPNFGTTVLNSTVDIDLNAVGGLAAGPTFGTPLVEIEGNIQAVGLDASPTFGTLTIVTTIDINDVVGLDASPSFGSPSFGMELYDITGLDAAAAFGTVSLSATADIPASGLAAGPTFGAPVVVGNQPLTPPGFSAAPAFGTPLLENEREIFPPGFSAAPAFGTPNIITTQDIAMGGLGLDASAKFGVPRVFEPAPDGWKVYLRARTNLNGTPDGQLWNVTNLKFLRIVNETGVGEFTIPLDAADLTTNRELLYDQEAVVDFEYNSLRRFRMRIDAHELRELDTGDPTVTFMGRDFSAELDETLVLPLNYPIGEGSTRTSSGSGPATWSTLIADAQAAGGGGLLGIGFGSSDSNATPWPSTTDIDSQLQVGTTLKAAAASLLIPGEVDWWCDEDGVLQAVPSLGVSRTAAVHLRVGAHQLSRTARTSRRRIINQALVMGPDGTIEADENVASSTSYGGRQSVLSVNTTDVAVRQAIGDAITGAKGDPIQSLDVVTRAFHSGHALWDDWDLGDTLSVDVEGIRDPAVLAETARVSAYTVETDLVDTVVEVVLGDSTEILEQTFDQRLQQVVNAQNIGLAQVSQLTALSGIPTGQTGIDPTGLTVTDRGGAAVNEAAISVNWSAPTSNAEAVVAYEVEVDDLVAADVQRSRTSQTNLAVFGLIPNTTYDITVHSINVLGERIGSVTDTGFTTAADSTAPAQVANVQILGAFGGLRVVWDPNTEPDVADNRGYYRLQVDADSAFGSPDVDSNEAATIMNLVGLTPQTVYFVRVAAIDSSGNQGPWSVAVNTSAEQVGTADIADDAIVTTHIADAQITNALIANATIEGGKIANTTIEGSNLVNNTLTNSQIQGGTIRSAEIQDGTIQGTDIDGGTITNANIQGGTITADEIEATFALRVGQCIESTIYTPGSAGWQIHADGSAELGNVIVRGTIDGAGGTFTGDLSAAGGTFNGSLSAADGTFTGTLSGVDGTFTGTLSAGSITGTSDINIGSGSNDFRVDSSGNMWLGATSFGSAPFSVSNAGVLTAQSGTFGGSLDAASGTFTGSLSAASGTFTGSLSSASGTFTGTLSGGSITSNTSITGATIDIGVSASSAFQVDSSGNMWLGGSTFGAAQFSVSNAGVLTAQAGTFEGTLNGGTITGGTINIGSGDFAVDSNGDMYINGTSYTDAAIKSRPVNGDAALVFGSGSTGGYSSSATDGWIGEDGRISFESYRIRTTGSVDTTIFSVESGEVHLRALAGYNIELAASGASNSVVLGEFSGAPSTTPKVQARDDTTDGPVFRVNAATGSYGSIASQVTSTTSAGSGWWSQRWYSSTFSDIEVEFRGDGEAWNDGAWNTAAADYAELFQSWDDSQMEHGRTVCMWPTDPTKVAYASDHPAEPVIGVVRPPDAPGVIGNDPIAWHGKWETDDFGGSIRNEAGEKQRSSSWVDQATYYRTQHTDPETGEVKEGDTLEVSDYGYEKRRDRDEWQTIGLMGQVPVKKGEPVDSRWVLMDGNHNGSAAMYLVR